MTHTSITTHAHLGTHSSLAHAYTLHIMYTLTQITHIHAYDCLLYTSDAADE